jgi:hypothetical protein
MRHQGYRDVLQTREQSLYVIHMLGTDYYKVGRAADPRKRLRQIQAGCPEPLKLAAVSELTQGDLCPVKVEATVHKHLAGYRREGEWFHDSNGTVIITAVKIAWAELCAPDLYERFIRRRSVRRQKLN